MQNLQMWQGSVVDKIMELSIIPAIAKKEDIDFFQLADEAVELAEERFKFSRDKKYLEDGVTKSDAGDEFCILDIHEVGIKYTSAELSDAYQNIWNAVINIPRIMMPDQRSLLVNYLKQAKSLYPNITNRQVEIETANVKPQIDLIIYDKKYLPIVMDWKVSDSWTSDYSRQLVIIGLVIYLKRLETPEKPAFRHEDIKLFEVNLLKGIVREHLFTEEIASEMIDEINLTSSDIKLIREDIKENNLTVEDFDTTDNQSTCKFCNFAALCSFLTLNKFQYDDNAYLKFIQDKWAGQN